VAVDDGAPRWRRYLDSITFEEAPGPLRMPLELAMQVLRRFIDVEATQQATILAAQAFTSLIPFTVVAAAFAPGDADLADAIVERFGLSGQSAQSVHQLFASAGETQSAVTWISIIILILSGLSFTRALQRLFQRAYGRQPRGVQDIWRGLAWIAAFAAWIIVSAPLRATLEDVGGVVFAVALATLTGFIVWLGTPLILLGERNWRLMAPGAAVSGFLGAMLSVASNIYVPLVMDWSAERYGLIGIAFALQSWLLVASFVVVIGAIVGAVVVERYGALHLRRLRARRR
jgi:membrane protein